jgi:hypothetical protein
VVSALQYYADSVEYAGEEDAFIVKGPAVIAML